MSDYQSGRGRGEKTVVVVVIVMVGWQQKNDISNNNNGSSSGGSSNGSRSGSGSSSKVEVVMVLLAVDRIFKNVEAVKELVVVVVEVHKNKRTEGHCMMSTGPYLWASRSPTVPFSSLIPPLALNLTKLYILFFNS